MVAVRPEGLRVRGFMGGRAGEKLKLSRSFDGDLVAKRGFLVKSEIASLVGNHGFSLDESQILSVCFWDRGRSVTESPSEMPPINKNLGDKMTQLNSVLVSSCSPKGPRNSRRRQSDVIDTTLRLARNPLISGVKQTVWSRSYS